MERMILLFLFLTSVQSRAEVNLADPSPLEKAYFYVTNIAPDPEDRKIRPIETKISNTILHDGLTRPYDPSAPTDIIDLRPNLSSIKLQLSLVHEVAHVIRHSYNPNEKPWLDEGIAKLIEARFSTVWAIKYQNRLHQSQQIGLSETLADFGPDSYNYLSSFFFVQYLYNRFGGDDMLSELMKNPNFGWDNVLTSIETLTKRGLIKIPPAYLSKESIWRHFAASLYFNDAFMAPYSLFQLDPRYFEISECKTEVSLGASNQESIYFSKNLAPADFDVIYGVTKLDKKIERQNLSRTYDCLIGIIYPK